MNNKKINSILRQLTNASHLYIDNVNHSQFVDTDFDGLSPVCPNGTPDHIVFSLYWEDADNIGHTSYLTERSLDECVVERNSFFLEDSEGEKFEIRLFNIQRENIKVEWK